MENSENQKAPPQAQPQAPPQTPPPPPPPVYVNGVKVSFPFNPHDIPLEEHIRALIAMDVRDDDVIVAAYPKCGTHWLWEVVHMLINKTTSHEKRTKELAMMEMCPVQELIEQKSPRILNSHLYMAHLPEAILQKKTKIIHIVRNPKDVMVSMFYHYKNLFTQMVWDNFVDQILSKKGHHDTQADFLRQMEEFRRAHPDQPIKTIYYEDLKKEPVRMIRELAEFLDATNSEEFYESVAHACHFDKLKQADQSKQFPDHITEKLGFTKPQFYRKGVIGDWKNQFTVAQNERVDKYIQQEMESLPYTFVYQ